MWEASRKQLIILLNSVAVIGMIIALIIYQRSRGPIILYGNVDIRSVILGFRVSGRISKLKFEEGDRVKKGDVLATLEREPFEKEVNVYQAAVGEAEATLDKALRLYERRKELVQQEVVSQGEFDNAAAAHEEAKAQLRGAQARLEQAQTELADTEMKSPDSGVILTRIREPGSVVAAGVPVYTLALDNPIWIRTYIDEPNLGNIYPGQKALVITDSGGTYLGQIGFISPQSEFTPKNVETTQLRTSLVYRLRIIVNDPNSGLRQGMPVTIKLEKNPDNEAAPSLN